VSSFARAAHDPSQKTKNRSSYNEGDFTVVPLISFLNHERTETKIFEFAHYTLASTQKVKYRYRYATKKARYEKWNKKCNSLRNIPASREPIAKNITAGRNIPLQSTNTNKGYTNGRIP
jgi:hypothetical protein